MSRLLKRMWRSPRLARVFMAVSAPALVSVFFAPLWAVFLTLIVTVGAAVFIYAEVLAPKFVQQSGNARSGRNNKPEYSTKDLIKAPESARGSNHEDAQYKDYAAGTPSSLSKGDPTIDFLPSGFGNHATASKEWLQYAWKALASSNSAQTEIRSVISLSTHSAMSLANSIRDIERNHDTQNHLAKNLLESTTSKKNKEESLADLASLASTILERQNTQLLDTAEHASRLIEKQQSAMMIASRADDLLGEADKAARQLALNVMGTGTDLNFPSDGTLEKTPDGGATSSKIIDPWAFVQNHRKTLKELRTDLEQIRGALSQVTLDMQVNVNSLRHTAQKESAVVASVNASIQKKLEETRSTVNALNELGKDTESHIQASIVAMQYHDIMTQKLAAVDNLHLEAIAIRTRNLVNGSNLPAPPESVDGPSTLARAAKDQNAAQNDQSKDSKAKHTLKAPEVNSVDIKKSNEVDLFV